MSESATGPEPVEDPTVIDWPARQARAALPFKVVNGRPVNPHAPTGVERGRGGLWLWGENLCADAIVTAHDPDGGRWIVMVERGDGHGWALPGGTVDPGEDPLDAAIRELGEEARIKLPACWSGDGKPHEWMDRSRWRQHPPRYVPDPRASDEAWMVTVPAQRDLGVWLTAPGLTAGDDARRAAWIPANSYADLVRHLAGEYGGQVFRAHIDLLRELLD